MYFLIFKVIIYNEIVEKIVIDIFVLNNIVQIFIQDKLQNMKRKIEIYYFMKSLIYFYKFKLVK